MDFFMILSLSSFRLKQHKTAQAVGAVGRVDVPSNLRQVKCRGGCPLSKLVSSEVINTLLIVNFSLSNQDIRFRVTY